MSQEACNFVTSLAAGRCRDVPLVLRRSAHFSLATQMDEHVGPGQKPKDKQAQLGQNTK